jgi:probable F420-dependent oxidoreductase
MKVGVIYPSYEMPGDAGAVKEWTLAVEAMGFHHVSAIDHVVGANKASRPNWSATYHLDTLFHEPFTVFSFMAGFTTRIGFVTGIIILPQRQTTLVAKQTACLDVLSGGRLRLGIGTGWNEVEYEALNMSFKDRGKMFDDQIHVLRELWTKPAVTLKTPYHTITDAGINPLPIQRPIPIWFGGGNKAPRNLKGPNIEKVQRRIARLGDGWLPPFAPDDEAEELLAKFHGYCREYGRDPKSIGIEGVVLAFQKNEDGWSDLVKAWQRLGATHICVNPMGDGLKGVEQHLRRLEHFKKALPPGLVG